MASNIGSFDTPGRDGGRYKGVQQDSHFAAETEDLSFTEASSILARTLKDAAKATQDVLTSGSTASIAIVTHDNQLLVAQVGDSPVLIYKKDGQTGEVTVTDITHDHSASNPKEIERVERKGGKVEQHKNSDGSVTKHRVGGVMAIARAFGDNAVAGISHEPSLCSHDLNEYLTHTGDKVWVVVASDGLTEKADPDHYQTSFRTGLSPNDIASRMAKEAMRSGSRDNISVTVAKIKKGSHPSYVLAVMDGHGTHGQVVSKTIKTILSDNVMAISNAQKPDTPSRTTEEPVAETIVSKMRTGDIKVKYALTQIGGDQITQFIMLQGSTDALQALQEDLGKIGIAGSMVDGKGLVIAPESEAKFNSLINNDTAKDISLEPKVAATSILGKVAGRLSLARSRV